MRHSSPNSSRSRGSRVTLTAGVAVVGLLVPAGSAVAVDSIDSGEVLAEHKRAQKHSVTLRGPKSPVVSGTPFKVTGTVVGAKPKKATVKLQRKKTKNKKKTWVTVAKTKTKNTKKKSRYSKKLTFAPASRVKLRAVVAKSSRYCSSTQQRQCGPKRLRSKPVTVSFTTPTPAAAPAAPPPQPKPCTPEPAPPCTVTNTDTGEQLTGANSIQQAINAATANQTLTIANTCNEANITIDKNLTLTSNGTIDAQQQGRVLTNNSGADLIISGNLTFTGGNAPIQLIDLPFGPIDVAVGGGIYNNGGTVTLTGDASISGNTADGGDGIYNGSGTVTVNGGSITGNEAGTDGGGIYNPFGARVTLNGGSITGNSPNNTVGVI